MTDKEIIEKLKTSSNPDNIGCSPTHRLCREALNLIERQKKVAFGCCPINTDLSVEHINDSWMYEYAIFELVRVYKTFDFENNALVLLGW